MNSVPESAYDETLGMAFFARTLSKIRLHASGELRPDFHRNLGNGADGRLCDFLRVDYKALCERTLAGGTDEEVLEWCYSTGRRLNKGDLIVWNSFACFGMASGRNIGFTPRLKPALQPRQHVERTVGSQSLW